VPGEAGTPRKDGVVRGLPQGVSVVVFSPQGLLVLNWTWNDVGAPFGVDHAVERRTARSDVIGRRRVGQRRRWGLGGREGPVPAVHLTVVIVRDQAEVELGSPG